MGGTGFPSTTLLSCCFDCRSRLRIFCCSPRGATSSAAAKLLANLPLIARVHGLHLRVALHKKARAVAHLGDRRHFAEIPYGGSENISPGLEIRSEVDGFEAPVEQVPAGRAFGRVFAVHVQKRSIIGGDVNPEMSRHVRERQLAAEIEDARGSGWSCGARDPIGGPSRGKQMRVQRLRV